LKILLTNFHRDRGGGHDTYILAIAQALSLQHRIFVAAPATSRLFMQAGALPCVTTIVIDFSAKFKDLAKLPGEYRALPGLLERERFDVIHVNGSPDHWLVKLVMLAWKGARPRIVLTNHDSIRIKTARATRATYDVIAVSDSTAQLMRESVYGRCPVTVIKNGIDTVGRYAPRDPQAAAQQRGAFLGPRAGDRLVIGTVTGFDWYKGTMGMIEAVAALPESLRDEVVVVVAGVEPNAEQRQQIEALGMSGRVHVAGFVEDVPSVIASFDIGFVLSYAIETVSFACREMMAMGKPVIVSRYAGLPENIDDGVDGWIVEPRDTAGLSSLLQTIIAGRDRLPAIGARARERAVHEFSDERFIADTEEVYRQGGAARGA